MFDWREVVEVLGVVPLGLVASKLAAKSGNIDDATTQRPRITDKIYNYHA